MLVDIRKVRSYVMNRILIIDDDKELCMLIKRSVCAENIEADICNTGREGIQQLKEQEYQLVILDVMMPGMDGFETLEEIRKEYSLPILMFTAKNDSASKVKGLQNTRVLCFRKHTKEKRRIWKKVCKAFTECSSKTGLF